jgi:hypothetical protein
MSVSTGFKSQVIAAITFVAICFPNLSRATSITLNSQPGDYVGGGITQTLTPIDGNFSISNTTGVAHVRLDAGDSSWSLDFAAPSGQPLVPGSYEGALRYPFQGSSAPGLDVSGSGRGSNTLKGRFDILQTVFDGSGKLQQFAANFEQHSEGKSAALFGNVTYNFADAKASPDEIRVATHMTSHQLQNLSPYLSQLANVPTGLFLAGQQGDYIVGPQTLTFVPTNASISVTGTASHISISVSSPSHNWHLDFVPPDVLPLTIGDWGNATRYPFQSPTKPGLSLVGDGRGSNQLTGDFEILDLGFGPTGSITRLDALFEQHSEGGVPASFGRIRFNAAVVPEPAAVTFLSPIMLGVSLVRRRRVYQRVVD